MKTEKQLNIKYSVFEGVTDLPKKAQELMQQAIMARENAYAPYSKFKVGAAVRLKNGQIFIGSNQENAAYPSGLCAERLLFRVLPKTLLVTLFLRVERVGNHFQNTRLSRKS